jgi:hypothetical protein
VYFVIETHALGQQDGRSREGDWMFFAMADCAHNFNGCINHRIRIRYNDTFGYGQSRNADLPHNVATIAKRKIKHEKRIA